MDRVSISIKGSMTMNGWTIVAPLARGAVLNAESWPAALARAMKQAITRIASRRRLRRDIDELRALDDRMLRDIGLRRGDIEYAVRYGRPFDRSNDCRRFLY
jgi:uncharacterized protein YjiS (DUF1127 family)